MPILQGPENALTKHLTDFEKKLGVDLKITPDGDLELNNLNDFSVTFGAANAAQAAFIKLTIEPGSLLYHPEIGTGLDIGSKTRSALTIKTQLLKSFAGDDRFDSVDSRITVFGSTYIVDTAITLAGSGIQIPLQFTVPV